MNHFTPSPDYVPPLEQPGYHCLPCQKDIPAANVASHLAGKKHRNRCALLDSMPSRPANVNFRATAAAKHPAIDSQSTYHCNVCARTVFTVLREQHLAGSIHVRGLAAANGWGGVPEGSGQRQSEIPVPAISGGGPGMAWRRKRELHEQMWRKEEQTRHGEMQRPIMVGDIAVSCSGKGKEVEGSTEESIADQDQEKHTSETNPTNLSPGFGRQEPFQQATPLLTAEPEPAFHGSFEEYLAKTSIEIQLTTKPIHNKPKPIPALSQLQKPTIPDLLTAQWYCNPCTQYLNIDERNQHLSSALHLAHAEPHIPTPSLYGDQLTTHDVTPQPSLPASIDTFSCLPCNTNILKSDRKFHLSPPYYCALCDIVMHTDTRDIHEWSLEHGRYVAAATLAPAEGGERWHCLTCERSFPVEVRPFHRSRAWECGVCGVRVHMDWIGAHLVGCGREGGE